MSGAILEQRRICLLWRLDVASGTYVPWDGAYAQLQSLVNTSTQIQASVQPYTTLFEYDGSNNPIYIGKAAQGSLTGDQVWQIAKLTFDASNNVTAIKYADTWYNFTKAWDDRLLYTYS